MNEIKLPAIKQVSMDGNTATYAIEPLTCGYGWTIGSVLKQALLSSLPGQAITCIRLAGWSPGQVARDEGNGGRVGLEL